jgi:hypothetical protein
MWSREQYHHACIPPGPSEAANRLSDDESIDIWRSTAEGRADFKENNAEYVHMLRIELHIALTPDSVCQVVLTKRSVSRAKPSTRTNLCRLHRGGKLPGAGVAYLLTRIVGGRPVERLRRLYLPDPK